MRNIALVLVLLVVGCGGSQARGAADRGPIAGDVDSPPSMEALPGTRALEPEFSDRMRFGVTLAEEAFSLEPPSRPGSAKVADVQAWSDHELKDWLHRRQHAVESARRELDAAAEEAHSQRVVAGAVVGLLYEDIARVLRDVPMPDELETDPEIARIFQDVVRSNAAPYLEFARRAYRACAANARGESLEPWSEFCAGRADRLPDPPGTEDGTTVTVVQDD